MTDEQKRLMAEHNIHLGARRTDIKPKKKDDADCPDGENCGEDFKQIGEAELLRHLKEGWQIVHRLNNGEIIMKKSSR